MIIEVDDQVNRRRVKSINMMMRSCNEWSRVLLWFHFFVEDKVDGKEWQDESIGCLSEREWKASFRGLGIL